MHNWTHFAMTGDQFIVAYATMQEISPAPLFNIGHAVELYLKATYIKITGDTQGAVDFGHNLKKIWDVCKTDNAFMVNYEIKDNIYKERFLEEDITSKCSPEDFMQYINNQELYLIVKYLMDIKYFGVPLKKITKPYSSASMSRNLYWVSFFKELRKYLNYSGEMTLDHVKLKFESNSTDNSTKAYLSGFFN